MSRPIEDVDVSIPAASNFSSARDAYLVLALQETPPNFVAARHALEQGANINVGRPGRRLIDKVCRQPARDEDGSDDMLVFLLENGADTNCHSSLDGFTPLLIEVWNDCIERAQLLLTMGNANLDYAYVHLNHNKDAVPSPYYTPLQMAVRRGRSVAMARLLVDHGAHVNRKTSSLVSGSIMRKMRNSTPG